MNQFRSTPELLKTFNAIGPALFTEDQPDPNVFQPAYHELTPAKTSDAACDASFTFIGCQSENGDDRAEAEAEAIAAWIQARDHSDLRRFALLFRRKRRIDAYLDVFDRRGLKYVVPPMGLFLDRPAAVDLLTVLRSIAYRYDVGAHVSAARTPYFALTDREITAGILGSDSPAWKAAMGSLESFRDAARHLTVTGLIDHVIRTSGIESVLQAPREGARSRGMSTALHADFGEEFISNPQHVNGDELCSEKVSHSRFRCLVPSRAEPFESSRRARGASARSFRDGTELLPPSRRCRQRRHQSLRLQSRRWRRRRRSLFRRARRRDGCSSWVRRWRSSSH